MKNLNTIISSTTHQKSQKQINDSGNYHADNRVNNNETRANNENSLILEQILSDMAWYG